MQTWPRGVLLLPLFFSSPPTYLHSLWQSALTNKSGDSIFLLSFMYFGWGKRASWSSWRERKESGSSVVRGVEKRGVETINRVNESSAIYKTYEPVLDVRWTARAVAGNILPNYPPCPVCSLAPFVFWAPLRLWILPPVLPLLGIGSVTRLLGWQPDISPVFGPVAVVVTSAAPYLPLITNDNLMFIVSN